MKFHPISYSPPMVRARRAGLKTMTRRRVSNQVSELIHCMTGDPGDEESEVSFRYGPHRDDTGKDQPAEWLCYLTEYPEEGVMPVGQCPYGLPGDQLWIKEEHYLFGTWRTAGRRKDGKSKLRFEPDQSMGVQFEPPNGLTSGRHTGSPGWYKRIGMFMPRWAGRDTDEIVSVRIERLQDITEADAIAEGVDMDTPVTMPFSNAMPWATVTSRPRSAREAYALLWESINGPGSWFANPFVWVIEFRRLCLGSRENLT